MKWLLVTVVLLLMGAPLLVGGEYITKEGDTVGGLSRRVGYSTGELTRGGQNKWLEAFGADLNAEVPAGMTLVYPTIKEVELASRRMKALGIEHDDGGGILCIIQELSRKGEEVSRMCVPITYDVVASFAHDQRVADEVEAEAVRLANIQDMPVLRIPALEVLLATPVLPPLFELRIENSSLKSPK